MGINWSSPNNDYDDSDISSSEENDEAEENASENTTNSKDDITDNDNEPEDMIDHNVLDSATENHMDASPPTASMTITVTLDQVMKMETEIDLYEKVSLVYLLYEDASCALNDLNKLIAGSTDTLIYNWAVQQNLINNKWQEKLVEALCIIQNYEVVSHLGYKKEDLVIRFMPHHCNLTTHVNQIHKALYFVCEEFGSNDFDTILRLVNADFKNKGLKFEVFPPYLELFLLEWERVDYIKQNNLHNLCNILKQMDQLDLADKLKELVPKPKEPVIIMKPKVESERKTTQVDFDLLLNGDISFKDMVSMSSSQNSLDNTKSSSCTDDSEAPYVIDPNKPGVCLIINQEAFYRAVDKDVQHLLPSPENLLENRSGTEQDKEQLVKTFTKFGFQVIVETNLIHSEIISTITNVANDIKDESSFIVCIMSHGAEGIVYGANSCKVPVRTIKNIICNKNPENLRGKPKVLILQSCQGTRCQRLSSTEDDDITIDGPSSSSEKVPPCADLLTFWATVPGYGAIRNKKTGSWFIQSLCQKMIYFGDRRHFEEICTKVIDDVSGKKWKQREDEVAMVPLKETTLRKPFYLPRIRV